MLLRTQSVSRFGRICLVSAAASKTTPFTTERADAPLHRAGMGESPIQGYGQYIASHCRREKVRPHELKADFEVDELGARDPGSKLEPSTPFARRQRRGRRAPHRTRPAGAVAFPLRPLPFHGCRCRRRPSISGIHRRILSDDGAMRAPSSLMPEWQIWRPNAA